MNVEGKYLEQEKIFFVKEKSNGGGKRGKYFERQMTKAPNSRTKFLVGNFRGEKFLG